MTARTLILAVSLLCSAAAAATGPGGPGKRHPAGVRPPHPGVVAPFFRFHHTPYPFHPFAWRGPMIWYPPPMYWYGPTWPAYAPPRRQGGGERCYHYFGQRYCVGGTDEAPGAAGSGHQPDFGTGPRLFNGD